ncbi:MAG: ABC transporter ATP-binding protein [Acidobacteria bacterium]|nr:MAG: ABC transporter ATP-binding protein [Acidobacteriota bacterium]
MALALSLHDVRKSFGKTVAVAGVTFDVEAGRMFGVIGPDGAGKTTTLRMICGLLKPDRGQISLFGADPWVKRDVATSSIGYLSQRFSLYGDLSIDENIAFFARAHNVPDFAARRTRLLALTGLEPFRSRLAEKLSGGMKQKLALACTLVHQPKLIVLDEPTTGVDPVSRREFWKLVAEFLADGLTIVLATPYLDEAERCSRVVLLSEGQVLALDQPGALQRSGHRVVLEVVVTPPRAALLALRQEYGTDAVQLFGDRLHAHVTGEGDEAVIRRVLSGAACEVRQVRRILPTLEDVFIEKLAVSRRGESVGVEA